MNEAQKNFEEKLLKEIKILNLKSIRTWHRLKRKAIKAWKEFDKQTGATRFAKKMALAIGLKLITLAAPNAQISLHAQTVNKKIENKALIAKANTAVRTQPEIAEFSEEHLQEIMDRSKEFSFALWEHFNYNIPGVQKAEIKGKTARTRDLRERFKDCRPYGIKIDPRYFCAAGGMGTLFQTIVNENFFEYEAILDCFSSPNSCKEIIKDFKKYFPNARETKNIQKALADIYKKNPYAVCVAFPRSKANSRSGYHYVTVFSNVVAVDTLVTGDDALKGKTARFNRTAISNTEDYFVDGKNQGYVFDLTEIMVNYHTFTMFMDALKERTKQPQSPNELKSEIIPQPVAALDKSSEERILRWSEVGKGQKTDNEPNLIASYLQNRGRKLS